MQVFPFFRHKQKSARLHFENWLQEQHRFGDEGNDILDSERLDNKWLLVI